MYGISVALKTTWTKPNRKSWPQNRDTNQTAPSGLLPPFGDIPQDVRSHTSFSIDCCHVVMIASWQREPSKGNSESPGRNLTLCSSHVTIRMRSLPLSVLTFPFSMVPCCSFSGQKKKEITITTQIKNRTHLLRVSHWRLHTDLLSKIFLYFEWLWI